MPSRRPAALLAALASTALAACGASNSDTAHVIPAPTANQTLTVPTSSTGTTGTTGSTGSTGTTTTPTVSTPKSGPLSRKPTVAKPTGAAPKRLVVKDIITGSGKAAKSGDLLTVNYVGVLYSNGKEFDSSWAANGKTASPFQATIGPSGNVIAGWETGLIGMKVGGRRELIIPPTLAYGATGQGTIPGNATLIFIVDVLAVQRASGATGVTGATVAPGALASTAATGTTGASSATGSTGAS